MPVSGRRSRRVAAALLVSVLAGAVAAGPAAACIVPKPAPAPTDHPASAWPSTRHGAPLLAVIIDDLGYGYDTGRALIDLAAPLSVAILPHTPYGPALAALAHRRGRSVLVHLPMEADHANHLLGPGALTSAMDQASFRARLAEDLAAVPGAIGVNNHMGSRLTTSVQAMHWLFEGLAAQGIRTFVDSRTTHRTVAGEVARSHRGLTYLDRDVFLDNELSGPAIAARLEEAVSIAERDGYAVAIGHPHRETLDVLRRTLPELTGRGLKLVNIGALAALVRAADGEHVDATESAPAAAEDPC